MRKIVTFILLACMLFTFVACNQEKAPNVDPREEK